MKSTKATLLSCCLLAASVYSGCGGARSAMTVEGTRGAEGPREVKAFAPEPDAFEGRMIYVVVALCDNVNQGIVPVPAALGNGEDPPRNLYWGARFGVKTFFKASRDWQLVSEVKNPRHQILERLVFKRRDANVYMVADAYRGAEIKQATADFLSAAAGQSREAVSVGGKNLGLSRGASSHLVAYVGHNGLMDFSLTSYPKKRDAEGAARDAVILACASKGYFADALREAGARPLLWTTNLMAPEAYVLKAAVDGWVAGDAGERVRERAANEYDAYQKCGLKAARKLFATGW
jgi:hypothetical protein